MESLWVYRNQVIGCVIIGTVTTIALAWFFAAETDAIPQREIDVAVTPPLVWPVPVPPHWHPPSRMQSVTMLGATRLEGARFTSEERVPLPSDDAYGVSVWRVGVPFRSLQRWETVEGWKAQPVRHWTLARNLPLRPLWFGFAFDTLVLSGIAFAMFRLYFGVRRTVRLRRGQCPSCGYALAGLRSGSKCPECGDQLL